MDEQEKKLADLRVEYSKAVLDESAIDPDPFRQFHTWFDEALKSGNQEVNACALATVDWKGRPSIRFVLLKDLDDNGFVFFTNYKSQKARDLKENKNAALCFFWQGLERQVRIEGKVEKVSAEESEAYFQSRPADSKLGAWASPQSDEIAGREWLEKRLEKMVKKFEGKEIERPRHWGGFRLIPKRMEFWQGRPSRLHDRILYVRGKTDNWKISRLAP